jgi:hypothetical protein
VKSGCTSAEKLTEAMVVDVDVVLDVTTLVDVELIVDVDVAGAAQPVVVHASQQLWKLPTHAEPPFGGVHFGALLLMLQLVLPLLVVRQQVTAAILPQVDLAAHFLSDAAQALLTRVAFAAAAAHLTYSPWLAALAQSQADATAARAAATSDRSGSTVGSHFVRPGRTVPSSNPTASSIRIVVMSSPLEAARSGPTPWSQNALRQRVPLPSQRAQSSPSCSRAIRS